MKIILGILLAFVVTISVGTAFGHGAGIEASPLIFTKPEGKKPAANAIRQKIAKYPIQMFCLACR
mgnify:CR=1 FL=1